MRLAVTLSFLGCAACLCNDGNAPCPPPLPGPPPAPQLPPPRIPSPPQGPHFWHRDPDWVRADLWAAPIGRDDWRDPDGRNRSITCENTPAACSCAGKYNNPRNLFTFNLSNPADSDWLCVSLSSPRLVLDMAGYHAYAMRFYVTGCGTGPFRISTSDSATGPWTRAVPNVESVPRCSHGACVVTTAAFYSELKSWEPVPREPQRFLSVNIGRGCTSGTAWSPAFYSRALVGIEVEVSVAPSPPPSSPPSPAQPPPSVPTLPPQAIGAIVGGVVGGLAFLAGVGFVIFLCRRHSSYCQPKPPAKLPVRPPHAKPGPVKPVPAQHL